ncbi:MAG TPA: 2-C-methyl-D-erythritol 4-phosphate cytidylyltransferase, partial [Terrimesophilobacter sp.]|nr:2-C-methyl-D-erythritol 4-phosphate cytidylyltransferase [Terrimesophilobacter sp.]
MSTAVIVVAAGGGTRLGAEVPKAFVEIGGRSLLSRAVDAALGMSVRPRVVAVVPEALVADARAQAPDEVVVVAGGASRQASVAAGLTALVDAADVDVVLVHDAARAFMPSRVFDAVEAEVRASGHGVVPGVPVVDTIKRVDAAERVHDTVDRAQLRAVQTPQGFPRAEFEAAYAAAAGHADGAAHTDGTVRPDGAAHPDGAVHPDGTVHTDD